MKGEYISLLVEIDDKTEKQTIDISNLSITQLIRLRETIPYSENYGKTIQMLDAIIKRDIETTIRTHNINKCSYIREYKKSKKADKQKILTKIRRKNNDKHKR